MNASNNKQTEILNSSDSNARPAESSSLFTDKSPFGSDSSLCTQGSAEVIQNSSP